MTPESQLGQRIEELTARIAQARLENEKAEFGEDVQNALDKKNKAAHELHKLGITVPGYVPVPWMEEGPDYPFFEVRRDEPDFAKWKIYKHLPANYPDKELVGEARQTILELEDVLFNYKIYVWHGHEEYPMMDLNSPRLVAVYPIHPVSPLQDEIKTFRTKFPYFARKQNKRITSKYGSDDAMLLEIGHQEKLWWHETELTYQKMWNPKQEQVKQYYRFSEVSQLIADFFHRRE